MKLDPDSTKAKILNAAYALFYREGFSRVSVDAIAEAAGVTKKTIYYHLKSKDDIVADVLNSQHEYVLHRFRTWAGPDGVPLNQIIENLFAHLKDWATGDGYLGSGFTRISTELADRPGHPARTAASTHKAMTESWLSEILEPHDPIKNTALAQQIMILIEGSMSLALIHGEPGYFDGACNAAKELVERR